MGVSALIGFGVSKAFQAVGQYNAGQDAKSIADYNAQIALQQEQDALDRGKQDEEKFRQGVKGLIGSQRTGFAGQGVDVGQGSAADVQADAAFMGELDALTIRNNAARAARGYAQQAMLDKMGGEAKASEGDWAAASTAIGAAGTIGSDLSAKYGFGGSSPASGGY